MKTLLSFVLFACVASVIMYAVAHPDGGVIYQSPAAALGVGLIGLGLCKQARKPRAA